MHPERRNVLIKIVLVIIGWIFLFNYLWTWLSWPTAYAIYLQILLVVVMTPLIMYLWLVPANLFFTICPEGYAKVIKRMGGLKKVVIQWDGYRLITKEGEEGRSKWDVVPLRKEGDIPKRTRFKQQIAKMSGGLRWIGIPPFSDVYVYKFRWTGLTEDGEIDPHEEWLDYFSLKHDVYFSLLKDAEDKKGLPVSLELVFTIAIVNPAKAAFLPQNWLELVLNQAKNEIVKVVKKATYEEWHLGLKETITEAKHIEEEIKNHFQAGEKVEVGTEEENLFSYYKDRYGVSILKIQVRNIIPLPEFLEATIEPYLAEQKGRAVEIKANYEKKRIDTVYKAIEKYGDLGKLIAGLESMEKGNLPSTVNLLAGLPNLVRDIYNKPIEEVSKTEIKELKNLLKKQASEIERIKSLVKK